MCNAEIETLIQRQMEAELELQKQVDNEIFTARTTSHEVQGP